MQGQDKGLVIYDGRPLANWVLTALAAQTDRLCISANRHLPQYQAMLGDVVPSDASANALAASPLDAAVWPDDPDLPQCSGPLAGIVTALRRCLTDWMMFTPCDMPQLPGDLVSSLMAKARATQADIVVPVTQGAGEEPRHHWACALVHKRVCPQTEVLLMKSERKVGNWVRSMNWSSVCFDSNAAFKNINTLETLLGQP